MNVQLKAYKNFLSQIKILNFNNWTYLASLPMKYLRQGKLNECGRDENGLSKLELTKNGPLGLRGKFIYLPKDPVIYMSVKTFGHWEPNEVKFLCKKLDEIDEQVIFLDVGANVGLITQQVNIASHKNIDLVMVEPIASNVRAIRKNVGGDFRVFEFALSDQDGQAKIYTNRENFGNSSLLKINLVDSFEQIISTKATEAFFQEIFLEHDSIVLKLDTEGAELSILRNIPEHIWPNIYAAVIEISPGIVENSSSLDAVLANIDTFAFKGWSDSIKSSCDIKEIKEYWISTNARPQNLYLSR